MEYQHTMVEGENSAREYAKFVLIILAIIFMAFMLHSSSATGGLIEYLRSFMGVFFLVFGSFKLIGYQMFTAMFAHYDIIAKRFKLYAYVYPFIELILAFFYLTNSLPGIQDLLTALIMGVGSVGVFQEMKRRSGIHCACLGNVIKLPLSTVSLVEDVGMGIMALVMLIYS